MRAGATPLTLRLPYGSRPLPGAHLRSLHPPAAAGYFSDLQKRLPAQPCRRPCALLPDQPCRRPCALLPLQLGEHTEQILREELGLSGEEIRRLREVGAI